MELWSWLMRMGGYCWRLKTQIVLLVVCSALLVWRYPDALQYYADHNLIVPKYWNWIAVADKFAFASILAFCFIHEAYKHKLDKLHAEYQDPKIDMLSSAIVYASALVFEAIMMVGCIWVIMTAVG